MARWIRFLMVLIASLWRTRLRPENEAVLRLSVWFTDVDLMVCNNAAYLVYLELGRLDFQMRTGFARVAAKEEWFAPMRTIHVEYWKPLRRFDRFLVFTKVFYWDDRWIYIEHRIERRGDLIASAVSKLMVVGRGGRLAPTEIASRLGFDVAVPSKPAVVARLQETEELMRERAQDHMHLGSGRQ